MIRFDAEHQRWVDDEADALRSQRQTESARKQRQALKGVFAVLAVCGLAFGTWALGWKDEPRTPVYDGAQPGPVISEPPASSPPAQVPTEAEDEPSPSASSTPPSGYEVTEDSEGFTIAVPEGWERRTESREDGSETVFYEALGGARQLQIFGVEDADPDASLELAEKNAEKNEGYDRKGLDHLDGGEAGAAARLEYTYDSEEHGGTRHVIDHRFEAEDGELYAIVAYGPEEDGDEDDEKEMLETALDFFCPSGAQCGDGETDAP
ncbi:hypothetical protein ACFPA8_01000 [Streptomyces ovatisporus]|uniref:Serine/arginine repetitive matrix protein 2 n=1 Tax=Streptomyces ovatisporus TaxID=1128682 RepID=A0ABV9A181_9ACTN